MKPRMLARIVVRSIGLFLVVWSIPNLPGLLPRYERLAFQHRAAKRGSEQKVTADQVAAMWEEPVRLLLGMYLLFGGRWLLWRFAPSGGSRCDECGYSLSGLPSAGRCPECGAAFTLNAAAQPPSGSP